MVWGLVWLDSSTIVIFLNANHALDMELKNWSRLDPFVPTQVVRVQMMEACSDSAQCEHRKHAQNCPIMRAHQQESGEGGHSYLGKHA